MSYEGKSNEYENDCKAGDKESGGRHYKGLNGLNTAAKAFLYPQSKLAVSPPDTQTKHTVLQRYLYVECFV